MRQDYPELFAAIKERVAEGRWEPIGGMWVEADCNLTGAESWRGNFSGRTFFREHFGPGGGVTSAVAARCVRLCLGAASAHQAGWIEYFFTIKIGWSQYNRMPYDTFWWQGLDGTRVLTHFSTTPEAAVTGPAPTTPMPRRLR